MYLKAGHDTPPDDLFVVSSHLTTLHLAFPMSQGFSGAELFNLVNQAALKASIENHAKVIIACLIVVYCV